MVALPRAWPGLSALFALLLCLLSSTALAQTTFLVTNTNDSGAGSLRQAILNAESHVSDSIIIQFNSPFPANGTINLASALPQLTKPDVTLRGTALDPRLLAPTTSTTAILSTAPSVTSLTISDLRFERGRSNTSGGCLVIGSSNISDPAVVATINRTRFTDCQAIANGASTTSGGALSFRNLTGAMLVVNSVFTENRVRNGTNGTANGNGGAIDFQGFDLYVERSQFHSNRVDMVQAIGGAIHTSTRIMNFGVEDSRFVGNWAIGSTTIAMGGAIGSNCFATCAIALRRNYFGDNLARDGGAVMAQRGNLGNDIIVEMTNNTFFFNEASNRGGAVWLGYAEASLNFNTFQSNRAQSGAHLSMGLSTPNSVRHNVFGSTVAGQACDIDQSTNTSTDSSYNAFLDSSCISRLHPGASVHPTLGLHALDTDHPVWVLRYAPGSVVIDGGAPQASCSAVDARNTTRPLDGVGDGVARCDIGAYEHPSPRIFGDGFEP